MFKNYLKLAWRNLLKDRQFTILNLSGLAVGLACALLIGLWIADEWSMEKYNPNDARLYQVRTNQKMENGIETGMYTPGILAKALKADLPEVEDASEVLAASWFSAVERIPGARFTGDGDCFSPCLAGHEPLAQRICPPDFRHARHLLGDRSYSHHYNLIYNKLSINYRSPC